MLQQDGILRARIRAAPVERLVMLPFVCVASCSRLRVTRSPRMECRARLSRQRFSQSSQLPRAVAPPGSPVHTRKREWSRSVKPSFIVLVRRLHEVQVPTPHEAAHA